MKKMDKRYLSGFWRAIGRMKVGVLSGAIGLMLLLCPVYSVLSQPLVGVRIEGVADKWLVMFSKTETVLESGCFNINASGEYNTIIADFATKKYYNVFVGENLHRRDFPTTDAGLLVLLGQDRLPLSGSHTVCINFTGIIITWIALFPGMNLISFPLEPQNPDRDTILDPIKGKYDWVWRYDPTLGWRVYRPNDPDASNLGTEMRSSVGYIIKMKENISGTLTIQGTSPPEKIPLKNGRNLVGYNSQTPDRGIVDCMKSIAGKYTVVWGYNPNATPKWRRYLPNDPEASNLLFMNPKEGYWIYTTQDCDWIIGP